MPRFSLVTISLVVLVLALFGGLRCALAGGYEYNIINPDPGNPHPTRPFDPKKPFEWNYSYADGINDEGRMLLHAGHFYLYDGDLIDVGIRSAAQGGINEKGQIVESNKLWTPAGSGFTETELPTLGYTAFAWAINDNGVIVGESDYTSVDMSHACVWHPDGNGGYSITALDELGGCASLARGINNKGQIVGFSENTSGSSRFPCVWEPDGSGGYTFVNLATVHGQFSLACDINEKGQIVGRDVAHACLWEPDGSGGYTPTNLGILPGGEFSGANAINEKGQIVGSSDTQTILAAFIATDDDGDGNWTMTKLGSLVDPDTSPHLWSARDINNNGQIALTALVYSSLDFHAFLLTPVPEPGTLALLALGGLFLLKKNSSRKGDCSTIAGNMLSGPRKMKRAGRLEPALRTRHKGCPEGASGVRSPFYRLT